ncbi:MAG TPA: hypothetical protein VGR21_02605 [Cryptosporangiaceae bacterium]|nr:hypothetical protein [Cryptosporangiaceae bacterium]
MLPTLWGRIQTRLFLLGTVGVFVTLLVTPLLPIQASLGGRYKVTFLVLLTVAVLGVVWEGIYHFLMQWRWEKDWPTLFGLVTLVPEGLLVWVLLLRGWVPGVDGPVNSFAFWTHFVLVWLAVWVVANGPMRVPFIRWRFRGGRLV